jgi:hypothetical protein
VDVVSFLHAFSGKVYDFYSVIPEYFGFPLVCAADNIAACLGSALHGIPSTCTPCTEQECNRKQCSAQMFRVFLSVSSTARTITMLLPIWMSFIWGTGRHAERSVITISYFGGPEFDSGQCSLVP